MSRFPSYTKQKPRLGQYLFLSRDAETKPQEKETRSSNRGDFSVKLVPRVSKLENATVCAGRVDASNHELMKGRTAAVRQKGDKSAMS